MYDADQVLSWKDQWLSQWASDVLRACNNYNQKFTRQSFFNVILFRFMGLSRSGVKILHTTLGGISLRTLDDLAFKERALYIQDCKIKMQVGIPTWYADNYTHRYVRRALEYGEPGYHIMDMTVVAMGTCAIARDRLRLAPNDVVIDPIKFASRDLVQGLIKDCVTAAKDINGKETLMRRHRVANWPPKPTVDNVPQNLRGKFT